MVKIMASMNTRLNIKKLDGNIVQKHGGSKQVGLKQLGSKQVRFKQLGVKQVGFKQLGPCVETGVYEVSNDDTAVAQRRLEDKQPEEKTNTECLVKEQEKEYQTGWKIKMGNILDSCNQRSTQQCMKNVVAKNFEVVGIQQQNGLVDEINVTLFAKVKGKQENDKIGTKPDKNGKRGKARQCRRPITVKKAGNEKKIQVQGIKLAIPISCIDSSKRHGLKLKFTQTSTTRGNSAIWSKLYAQGLDMQTNI
nr:zinc finger, CCHC-type [Tanacetum cinerariifolium]